MGDDQNFFKIVLDGSNRFLQFFYTTGVLGTKSLIDDEGGEGGTGPRTLERRHG